MPTLNCGSDAARLVFFRAEPPLLSEIHDLVKSDSLGARSRSKVIRSLVVEALAARRAAALAATRCTTGARQVGAR